MKSSAHTPGSKGARPEPGQRLTVVGRGLRLDGTTQCEALDLAPGQRRLRNWELRVADLLPDERAAIRIDHRSQGGRVAWGSIIELEDPHPARRKPPCPIHERCGGCGLQALPLAAQLEAKTRSGLLALPDLARRLAARERWLEAPAPWDWRHKAVFLPWVRKGRLQLGAYARGSHDVVDQPDCRVLAPALRQTRDAARAALEPATRRRSLLAHPPGSDGDGLRALVLRANLRGEVLLTVVARGPSSARVAARALTGLVGGAIVGLHLQVHDGPGDSVSGAGPVELVAGAAVLDESVGGLTLGMRPLAFFQVHPAMLDLLAARVAEHAAAVRPERIADVYCGGGALGLAAAQRTGAQLFGVEVAPDAIEEARRNAERNGVFALFEAGRPSERLVVSADVAIVDPPRAGCRPPDLAAIIDCEPRRLIYVACGVGALARDARRLAEAGYALTTLEPADMLPHTAHVEWIAVFDR